MKTFIAVLLVFGTFGFGKVPPKTHPGAQDFPNVYNRGKVPVDPPEGPRPALPSGASPQGQRPHRPLRPLPKVPLGPGEVAMP
ncbi:MAG TPA: hypothetical protein VMV18_06690 [bacterium]|nr:hypothetical protein [bacterium]